MSKTDRDGETERKITTQMNRDTRRRRKKNDSNTNRLTT